MLVRTIISPDSVVIPHPEVQFPYVEEPKPCGLWYEVDGDWRRWCVAENFRLGAARYLHRLEFDGERVLEIRDVEELDAFHEQWGIPLSYRRERCYPDWSRLADEYDGIEIAPYVWERRLDGRVSDWYCGWDCASGVIWRPRGMRATLIGPLMLQDGRLSVP